MSSQEDSTMSELTDDEPATTATDIHPEDPDDDWSAARVKSGLRLHVPTAVLLGLIILAGGFWGGAVAEKHHGSGSAAAANPLSALARQFAASRGSTAVGGTGAGGTGAGGTGARGGAGGGAAGFGAAASGTVIGVSGQTLDISDASGNIVKVQIASSTTITRTSKSSLGSLQVGDTVVVAGSTASNGVVSATSVRASAAGTAPGGTGSGGSGFAGSGFSGSGG
jgi:hypothetical protein